MSRRGHARGAKGQLSLVFPDRWGGARKRAGRKPGPRPKTAHRTRPPYCERHPVHVTLRSALRLMRSERVVRVLRRSLRASLSRAPERFRVVEFSIQSDHLHLLVEAADKQALSRGMQGLAISMARRVNQILGRQGRFWADRFHARGLKSPRAVRHGLVYVLANFRKHAPRHFPPGIDRFASAATFDGWFVTPHQREALSRIAASGMHGCVARARTWLLRVGWRRHGLITLSEQPARPG